MSFPPGIGDVHEAGFGLRSIAARSGRTQTNTPRNLSGIGDGWAARGKDRARPVRRREL